MQNNIFKRNNTKTKLTPHTHTVVLVITHVENNSGTKPQTGRTSFGMWWLMVMVIRE